MENAEAKNRKSEYYPEIADIEFNAEKGIIISVNNDLLDTSRMREIAKSMNLNEKEKNHLTIIGSDTAEAITASLAGKSSDEREIILAQIKALVQSINWKFTFRPEFYYIKKEYNDPDPNDQTKTIPETRESMIQMAETDNLKEFYLRLEEITGLKFEIPIPHITLFTNSTREDKRLRGIGIYSENDFKALNPQLILAP